MSLFQRLQNSLEQRVETVSHDEAVLKQSEVWTRSVLWGLMATTALGIGWLAFAKTDEIVTAKGKLQPIGSVKEIQMPTGGIAKQILVKDGDRVKAGQLLIQLDAESSQQKQESLRQSQRLKEQELDTLRSQQRLKRAELQRYLEENGEEINKLEATLRLDQDIENRLLSLSKEGAAGELQHLQQRNKVQESVGQLKQTRIQRLRQA
ncbi:MAG: biotin/lipoyl-binding protein, partial [Cyanobium sp.]